MEAAQVWTLCRDLHLAARQHHTPWPRDYTFHLATKGRFALHSQTVQAIFRTFEGNIEATRELRTTNPKIRYPYKDKRYYPLLWPAQAVSRERGRLTAPVASHSYGFSSPGDGGEEAPGVPAGGAGGMPGYIDSR